MKLPQFMNVVPRPVKTAAPIIVGCTLIAGLIARFVFPLVSRPDLPPGLVLASGAGIGLLAGVFIAAWMIGLGYVYADARRRAMPPILSTLMAALVPNLLGFLIYFVIRRPLALPCAQCGQAPKTNHRFCSWCGYQGTIPGLPAADAAGAHPTATA